MKLLVLLSLTSAGALLLQDTAPQTPSEHVGKLPDGGFLIEQRVDDSSGRKPSPGLDIPDEYGVCIGRQVSSGSECRL